MVTGAQNKQAGGVLRSIPELFQVAITAFAISDLRNKILFTFGILIAFRFLAHVTIPGANLDAFQAAFDATGVFGIANIFSGGALQNLSIASLGVYPYITASIVMQILTPVIKPLRELSREGERGRAAITRYTHYLTIPLAFAYAYGQINLLNNIGGTAISNFGFGANGDVLNTITILFAMTAATMLLVWMGELITEKGIGNGISLIIFVGIVTTIPAIVVELWLLRSQLFQVILLVAIILAILYFVVYITEAQRRIPVQYGRNIFRSGRMYRQTGASHIPLRINAAGMIPLIFAFAIISLPSVIASYFADPARDNLFSTVAFWVSNNFGPISWVYWMVLFLLVVMFSFIYTFAVYSQQNIAENLQKNGGFIPGIRPGKPTRDYLVGVILRITWGGALFLGLIAIAPWLAQLVTNIDNVTTIIQSTSLLIMVGVALDTLRQLEAQLLMRNYQEFV